MTTAADLPRIPHGALLRLKPGECYLGGDLAEVEATIRVVAVDRISPRLRGDEHEVWVSGHGPNCAGPSATQHMPCFGGYVQVRAIIRCLADEVTQ